MEDVKSSQKMMFAATVRFFNFFAA